MNHPALLFNNKHILKCLVFIFTASLTTSVTAGVSKLIRARANTAQLSVDMTPVKSHFAVNEKIRLRSKGNKPYYLYLFNRVVLFNIH